MTKPKKLWLYFSITMSVYLVMLLITIPKLNSFSHGLQIINVVPFYDSSYVVKLLENLQSDGRNYYLKRQLPLDMIYPLLYGFTYWKILSYFIEKLARHNLKFMAFLPILSAIFDYLENISIATLLYRFPSLPDTLLSMLPFFSLLKTIFSIMYLLVFFVFCVIILLRHKKANYDGR